MMYVPMPNLSACFLLVMVLLVPACSDDGSARAPPFPQASSGWCDLVEKLGGFESGICDRDVTFVYRGLVSFNISGSDAADGFYATGVTVPVVYDGGAGCDVAAVAESTGDFRVAVGTDGSPARLFASLPLSNLDVEMGTDATAIVCEAGLSPSMSSDHGRPTVEVAGSNKSPKSFISFPPSSFIALKQGALALSAGPPGCSLPPSGVTPCRE